MLEKKDLRLKRVPLALGRLQMYSFLESNVPYLKIQVKIKEKMFLIGLLIIVHPEIRICKSCQ